MDLSKHGIYFTCINEAPISPPLSRGPPSFFLKSGASEHKNPRTLIPWGSINLPKRNLLMSELVFSLRIPALLGKLSSGEWLLPEFQREFVWDVSSITSLVTSVIEGKPIGMATIWEQEDDSSLDMHHIWLYDRDPAKKVTFRRYYGEDSNRPNRTYAVLDGRQRSTALAIAFGGFKPEYGKYRLAGRFFVNVASSPEDERVVFVKDADLKKRGLLSDASCISEGLFPLVSFNQSQDMEGQWLDYMFHVKDPTFYKNGLLPSEGELEKRVSILKDAHKGIFSTELAVYKVPKEHSLGEICEIFETLNTTGTVVSTVDLIHSWLYADTSKTHDEPLLLREWMADLGQKDGAIGWAVPKKRPELIAQLATACHVAAIKKYEPRTLKGRKPQKILSVKSPDLLATPTEHWLSVIQQEDFIAELLSDFQNVVAGGTFPFSQCPYPISAFIYVGIRWHKRFDEKSLTAAWEVEDLNILYKAFFWSNAISGRYDQGFLTKIGTDIDQLKSMLNRRRDFESRNEWAQRIDGELQIYLDKPIESKTQLVNRLTRQRSAGAFQAAVVLSMQPRYKKDFVSLKALEYPSEQLVELHHIFPTKWTKKNLTKEWRDILDPDGDGIEWEASLANLMPISRETNGKWNDYSPATFIEDNEIKFDKVQHLLEPVMIDKVAFDELSNPKPDLEKFWVHRAGLMADYLLALIHIKL